MKYALRKGYDAAVQFDADGQHMPQCLECMIHEMDRTNADIVIGSRFVEEKEGLFRPYDGLSSYLDDHQADYGKKNSGSHKRPSAL